MHSNSHRVNSTDIGLNIYFIHSLNFSQVVLKVQEYLNLTRSVNFS